MTILVTGATGQLGGLAVRHLLDRVSPGDLVVSVRDPARAAHLAERGVAVRQGDFTRPDSLDFHGVDTLLLISADGPEEVRGPGHAAAVAAARKAGVRRLVYTSLSEADASPLLLARVHAATEAVIRDSGLAFTFLRNGLYHEAFTDALPQALACGALVTATGAGEIATASRDDLALAAAVVLTEEGHEGAVYELTGPRAWRFAELAGIATEVAGQALAHVSVSDDERRAVLADAGLPGFVVDLLVDAESHIRAGALSQVRPDLAKLIGREPTPVERAVSAALGG
ncbi:SDR family oxidoreductase [Actinokineospora iranica]|uniref:NAD(P)H dehydrogenase (Quinone) n=1 Tax=Actinokineospora iranica TaxID=1271860 RepID=A0A1G6TLF0_9PSEU|nr:SDR family oxidoreductase [Actinokineospora iranica]SDD29155.1 NAD(P)H dehydrogenase (quinone) [Actinokineospora iranica]